MDSSLVARAQAGDKAALDTLLEEIAPLVHRFGVRMCRHEADADDVLQDTLLAVASHLSDFEGRASLSSWVFTLARTACARKRRGLKNQAHGPEDALGQLVSSEHSPEEAAGKTELAQALEKALRALSDDYREVLLMRDMEGLSAAEVAAALGLGVDAVKSRLHRARGALRESLRSVLERDAPPPLPGCPDILAAFSKQLEGDLEGADCAAIERHVSGCASCGAACDALQTALGACRAQSVGSVSDAVKERIKRAINALVANIPA